MSFIKTSLAFLLLLISACHAPSTPTQGVTAESTITIATAANMQFAMQRLSDSFSQQSGIDCQLVINSSGKLTAQIIQGAPYDILVAANRKYPDEIVKNGLAASPTKIYAYGKLVLWTMTEQQMPSLEALRSEMVKHIAIANPKTAPYGQAATELLHYYGLYEPLKSKLVYGESIAQTNQFINSKSAELGFTAKSVVLSSKMKGKGKWIDLDEAAYQPIEQGIVLVKREDKDSEMAQKFYDFLSSPKAKQVLEDYGYSIPTEH